MVFSFNTRYPLSSYVFKASKEKKTSTYDSFFFYLRYLLKSNHFNL